MMIVEFDSDGYPIPRTLTALKRELATKSAAGDFTALKRIAQEELHNAIDNGRCASGGPVDKEVRGDIMALESFSTGGWSGNEEIIDLVLGAGNGIIRIMYLQAWERGGHYFFNWSYGGN